MVEIVQVGSGWDSSLHESEDTNQAAITAKTHWHGYIDTDAFRQLKYLEPRNRTIVQGVE